MISRHFLIRSIYIVVILLAIISVIFIGVLAKSKTNIFSFSIKKNQHNAEIVEPFPVSVNSFTKVIATSTTANDFYHRTLANNSNSSEQWWNKLASVLSSKNWYQNLASPVSRIIVIWPGERKEQITKNVGDILGWNKEARAEFKNLIDSTDPIIAEGKYFPGQYVSHRKATPQEVKTMIFESFQTEIIDRYTEEVEAKVPLKDALIIASLIEREASDFENKREVSGVIWNRIFIDMPLQLDATLQYVRGSNTYEPKWWPIVRSSDKYLESPYNTYKYSGLPPAPIASPSIDSLLAALNPVVTDCLFYFHTDDGDYYCSENYKEHISKLRSIYGRGS